MNDVLSLKTAGEYSEIAVGESRDLFLSVRLKAGEAKEEDSPRADMTVLFVLDISSSMRGEPLAHVLAAVEFLVTLLRPTDRVGVMTFSKQAEEVIAVGDADEEHLRRLRRRLRDIESQKWTNFETALHRAEKMMPEPRGRERQIVLFLSDGYPSVGNCSATALTNIVRKWRSDLIISTLGFAEHHDPQILESMSRAGGGSHHFIADPRLCEFEFSTALGAQQSIVAADVELQIEPRRGVEVVDVISEQDMRFHGTTACLDLPDFAAENSQLLVVQLKVDRGDIKGRRELAEICVRYHDEVSATGAEIGEVFAVDIADSTGEPCTEVYAERLVAAADDARRKARYLAKNGSVTGARKWLADMISRMEKAPGYKGDDGSLLSEICEDLREERQRLKEGDARAHQTYINNNSVPLYSSKVNDGPTTLGPSARARHRPPSIHPRQMEIIFQSGPLAGKSFPVRETLVVGRSQAVDVVVDDDRVSRRHLQFLAYGGKSMVRDLASQNGTFVNGEEISICRALNHGDIILLGDTQLRVVMPGGR